MTPKTKLKLLMPIAYLLASCLFFITTWPNPPKLNHYTGAGMTLLSFALWIVARVQLGNAFSLAPKSKFIVKSGLYSKLRHPVYYFSVTAVTGIAVYTLNIIAFLALTALIVLEAIRIQAEEKLLAQTFGEEYVSYKKQTWF